MRHFKVHTRSRGEVHVQTVRGTHLHHALRLRGLFQESFTWHKSCLCLCNVCDFPKQKRLQTTSSIGSVSHQRTQTTVRRVRYCNEPFAFRLTLARLVSAFGVLWTLICVHACIWCLVLEERLKRFTKTFAEAMRLARLARKIATQRRH